MHKYIVIDTSSLIAFHKLSLLSIFQKLYPKSILLVTDQISTEFKIKLPVEIQVREIRNHSSFSILNKLVDAGEASAITLCLEWEDSLLIVDDAKGRKLAKQLGILVTGTLGILIKAKRSGLLPAIKPLIEKLVEENFRLDKSIIKQALNEVGET